MALQIKDEIYHLIRNDVKLRFKMGIAIGVSDNTIYQHASKKANKLYDYNIIKILMEHTGKTEKDIFDKVDLKVETV